MGPGVDTYVFSVVGVKFLEQYPHAALAPATASTASRQYIVRHGLWRSCKKG